MKRKVILNVVVIAVLLALFVVLSLIVDNGAVGQYMDADGFIMTQEQVDAYVAEGGSLDDLSTVDTPYYATYLALLPPVIAIVLALITKEVFSSLFVGVLAGALLATDFNPVNTLTAIVNDGFIASAADAWNAGILIFLVLLGMMVALINKAGGCGTVGSLRNANSGNYIDHIYGTAECNALRYETLILNQTHWMTDHSPMIADIQYKK